MDKHEYNAGYAIEERFLVGELGIVLGHSKTAPAPYVTWNYRKDSPMHYFWGHYFADKSAAYKDYETRINEEVEHYEAKTGKPFPIPALCLTIEPSSGDLINVKRGFTGYFPSDWNRPREREHNRMTADLANEGLHVSKAQEAAMCAGSMFGWHCPAADPQNYDDNGLLRHKKRSEPER